MAEYTKPTPLENELNAPFFKGSMEGKIRLQKGAKSGAIRFPYSPVDPTDLSVEADWVDMSGRATLWSWVVFHQAYFPSFKDEIPYPVIFVKLDEGPMMIASIPSDVSVDDLHVDMPMQAEFEPASDNWSIAKFRPVSA